MNTSTHLLNAEQAAARLGVKRATLYAYVSRGVLSRTLSLDGRTSLFDPVEVERLGRRRGKRKAERNVLVVSSITDIVPSGHRYRGVAAADFVADGVAYEQVANHLWQDDTDWDLEALFSAAPARLDADLAPTASFLHRLQLGVTAAAAADPMRATLIPQRFARCGRSMIVAMVDALPVLTTKTSDRLEDQFPLAQQLWPRLTIMEPTPERIETLNALLVLVADHGLASSTFAVRVAASVRCDPYAAVQVGLGTMSGVLHGAAPVAALRLIERASTVGAPAALGEAMQSGQPVPGVGHLIYTDADPRHDSIMTLIETAWANDQRLEPIVALEELMAVELAQPPSIDFATAALLFLIDADPEASHLFALARTAGWLAHAAEELDERPLRFRPQGRYLPPRRPLPEDRA